MPGFANWKALYQTVVADFGHGKISQLVDRTIRVHAEQVARA